MNQRKVWFIAAVALTTFVMGGLASQILGQQSNTKSGNLRRYSTIQKVGQRHIAPRSTPGPWSPWRPVPSSPPAPARALISYRLRDTHIQVESETASEVWDVEFRNDSGRTLDIIYSWDDDPEAFSFSNEEHTESQFGVKPGQIIVFGAFPGVGLEPIVDARARVATDPTPRPTPRATPVPTPTPVVKKFSIRGTVTTTSGKGLPGARLTVSGVSGAVLTDAAGAYALPDLPPGRYRITPIKSGYTFVPATLLVNVGGADVRGIDFIALGAGEAGIVSGRVTAANGGLAGVQITRRDLVSGTTANTLTNSSGYYVFSPAVAGSYVITPTLSGYSFTPARRTVTLAAANINIDFTAAPLNDSFARARPITGGTGLMQGSSIGASKEPGEPAHAGQAGGKSVWYRWTAPSSGRFFFTTVGSDFDTLLAIYRGNTVNALRLVAANDDEDPNFRTSTVSLSAGAGQIYYIAIDGYGAASGHIVLSWAPEVNVGTTPAASRLTLRHSAVTLSSATARVATNNVQLTFSGAVDGELASDPAHYVVLLQGHTVAVESAAYNANRHAVTLALPAATLHFGDSVAIRWSGVQDTSGNLVAGQVNAVVVR